VIGGGQPLENAGGTVLGVSAIMAVITGRGRRGTVGLADDEWWIENFSH
jgi:hypothetical protein